MDISVKEPASKAVIDAEIMPELRWWAKQLKTDMVSLGKAVRAVGTNPADVRAWLADEAKAGQVRAKEPQSAVIIDPEIKKPAAPAAKAAKPNSGKPTQAEPAWFSLGEPEAQTAQVAPAAPAVPTDQTRIDAKDDAGLPWWAAKFGTDVVRLKEALVAIGENPKEVREYLDKRAAWEKSNRVRRFTPEQYQAAQRQRQKGPIKFNLWQRFQNQIELFGDAVLNRPNDPEKFPDRAIFLNDPACMRAMADRLGTTVDTLRVVVQTVGNNYTRVAMYLKLRQAYQSGMGARNEVQEKKAPRRFLPRKVHEFLFAFRRKREAFYDRYLPKIPWERIPFLKNKYVLRGLALATTMVVFRLVTGGQEVDGNKLSDALVQQQLQQGDADMQAAAAQLEQARAQGQFDATASTLEAALPPEAQAKVDKVRAQLAAAEAAQAERLDQVIQVK